MKETEKQKRTGLKKLNLKNKNAITLLALVVTIVIILILAGITIAIIKGDNGIIAKTKNAKEQTIIDNEKSILDRAKMLTLMRNKQLIKEHYDIALDEERGENTIETIQGEISIIATFVSTGHKYAIKDDSIEIIPDRSCLKVNDKIIFQPDKNTNGTNKKYQLKKEINGDTEDKTIIQEDLEWRVLKIYEDGSIDIVSEPTNTRNNTKRSFRIQ